MGMDQISNWYTMEYKYVSKYSVNQFLMYIQLMYIN